MSVIDKIKAKLENYPQVRYEADSNNIHVFPTTNEGFTVWLNIDDRGVYTVNFDGWHEHFDNEEEALNCFAFGLSNKCRLKVQLRGNFPHKWTVEYKQGEGWVEDSTHALLVSPFWKPERIVYLTNDLIHD